MRKAILAVSLGLALLGFAQPQAYANPAPEKEWTFLVFLNGDNNLDSFGTADMKEMEMVGSSDQVNIVVLRDTSRQNVSSKIYYVEKGHSRVVKDYGSNIDMGDWRNLVDFFRYAKEHYPAKKYFIDIWNHGGGWRKGVDLENNPTRGISYDDHTGNYITTPQLGEAFRQMQEINGGKKLDVLGMDACVMQMAEVSFEVKDTASVVVGSEDNEPADGWAYQLFLAELVERPEMDGAELGIIVEREYARSYDGGPQGRKTVQGSAVSTEKLSAAMENLNAFLAQAIALAPLYHHQFTSAIPRTQRFAESAFKDLIHYLMVLRGLLTDPGLQQSLDRAIESLEEAVLANFITGSGLDNSKGIAIWLPDSFYYQTKRREYAELAWSRENLWDEFLEVLLVPSFPILSAGNLKTRDHDGDGFLRPGEEVTLQFELKNDSATAAQDVRVSVSAPCGVATTDPAVTIPHVGKGSTIVSAPLIQLRQDVVPGDYVFRLLIEAEGVAPVEKEFAITVDREYTIEDHAISTPHPYPANMREEWEISRPGAEGLRIHFSRFETENRFDTVVILNKEGTALYTLDGNLGAFWTPIIPGDTVRIRMQTDASVSKYGFDIDRIAF